MEKEYNTFLAVYLPKNPNVAVFEFHGIVEEQFQNFSNFVESPFVLEGRSWPSANHYFQAAKFCGTDNAWMEKIGHAETPFQASRMGKSRAHPIQANWNTKRNEFMKKAIYAKFEQNKELASLLLSTGDNYILCHNPEDGWWGDGSGCGGKNQNHLGLLLQENALFSGGLAAVMLESSSSNVLVDDSAVPLMPGDGIRCKVNPVSLLLASSETQTAVGVLYLTAFQLLHISRTHLPGSTFQHGNYILTVPIMTINTLAKKNIDATARQIKLYTKDMRCIKIVFTKSDHSTQLIRYLRSLVPLTDTQFTFAFRNSSRTQHNGWNIYDPIAEFNRMGIYMAIKKFTKTSPNEKRGTKIQKAVSASHRDPKKSKKSLLSFDWVTKYAETDSHLLVPERHKATSVNISPSRRRSVDCTISHPSYYNIELTTPLPVPKQIYSRRSIKPGKILTQSNPPTQRLSRSRHSIKLPTTQKDNFELRESRSREALAFQTPPLAAWLKVQTGESKDHKIPMKAVIGKRKKTKAFPLDPECRIPPSKRKGSFRRSISADLTLLGRAVGTHRKNNIVPSPPPLPQPSVPVWQVTNINADYEFSPTYPPYFCIPSRLTLEQLNQCASFRSKGRLPILTWKKNKNPASLLRCAQPLVGLANNHSSGDEEFLRLVLALNPSCKQLHIIDARSKNAANANHARGAGVEGARYATNCTISFMNIENIHAMRESQTKLFDLLKKKEDLNWLSNLDHTGWLKHIRLLLIASKTVTDHISDGDSVLVHCSDGWDRTAQICALAQLALDPYFRTIEGFLVLIEKEWLQFGHKFADRTGHAESVSKSEMSPVFLQFMDCVHQLLVQFPCSFQFNEILLVFIMDELFSCRFGTFLVNSMKERLYHKLVERTPSLWADILANKEKYTNMLYAPNPSVLNFSTSPRVIQLWKRFFLRWDEACTPKENSEEKLNYLLHEIERRQNRLKQIQSEGNPMKRISSVLAFQQVKETSNLELDMRHFLYEILETALSIPNESPFENSSSGEIKRGPQIPSHWANNCFRCEKKFSQFRRKNHCKACGQVFCGSCSKSKVIIPSVDPLSPVRVCDNCAQLHDYNSE